MATRLPVEYIGSKQGLSQGYVPSILQDKSGFMWFATKDGLNKFDGYRMKVYRNNPQEKNRKGQLTDNDISSLAIDSIGNIWVATVSKGLFVFDPKHEWFFPAKQNPSESSCFVDLQIRGNELYALNSTEWLIYDLSTVAAQMKAQKDRIDLKRVTGFVSLRKNSPIPLPAEFCCSIFLPDKSIWMGQKDSIIIFRKSSAQSWQTEYLDARLAGMQDQERYSIFSIGKGDTLVFVGLSCLSMYHPKSGKIIFKKEYKASAISKETNYYNFPAQLDEERTLMHDKNGWYIFHARSLRFQKLYSNGGDFSGKSRWVSPDGYLWVGTGGLGIHKFNLQAALFQTDSMDANGFEEDDLQRLYIKFRTGTQQYDWRSKLKTSAVPDLVKQADIKDPVLWYSDHRGILWYGGVSKTKKYPDTHTDKIVLVTYSAKNHHVVTYDALFRRDTYFHPNGYPSFFIDHNNNFWQLKISSTHDYTYTVTEINTGKIIHTYSFPKEILARKTIYKHPCHFEDRSGQHWFGTNDGLFKLNTAKNTWTFIEHSDKVDNSLSGNPITCLLQDAQNDSILWVGTAGHGLNKLNIYTLQSKHYSDQNGLPNNVINAVLQDNKHNIWISTNQGLCCMNPITEKCLHFSQEDGLAGDEFNTGQAFKSKEGLFLFGGVDGITYFQPEECMRHPIPDGKMIFTELYLMNTRIQYPRDSDILSQSFPYAEQITVPYDKNFIRIEFALLDFTSKDKKKYRYFIKGYTDSWIDIGNSTQLVLSHMNAGTYQLMVQGCSAHGVWSSEYATLLIHVQAPWYKTIWFISIMCLLLIVLTYLIYRYRLKQSLKMVMMRNTIASDLHDEIGSTISSITVYSDILEDQLKEDDLRDIARRIGISSREILIAMSDIVWSINPKNDRFDHVVLRMKTFANELLETRNIQVDFNVEDELLQMNLQMNQRKNFYLIFKEAVHNVLKYAMASNLNISLKRKEDLIVLTIRDNGVGFNTLDYDEGNGIENMKNRAIELNGTLEVLSQISSGTTVYLSFPIKKSRTNISAGAFKLKK